MIADLMRLYDLALDLKAYAMRDRDPRLIKEISNIKRMDVRSVLWYDVPQKVKICATRFHRIIYELTKIADEEKELTQAETTGTLNKAKENERDALPVEFRSVEAGKLLGKLIQNKFCDDKYDWKYTKSLLAYFAQKASDTLKLSNRTMSTGQNCVSWKPFESLFTINGKKVRNLSQASQDIVNKGKPNGYKDIDSLF